jgi:hypothetical protein
VIALSQEKALRARTHDTRSAHGRVGGSGLLETLDASYRNLRTAYICRLAYLPQVCRPVYPIRRQTTTAANVAAVVLRSDGNEAYASVSPSGVSRIFLAAYSAAAAPRAAAPKSPVESALSPAPVAGRVVTGAGAGVGAGGAGLGGFGW